MIDTQTGEDEVFYTEYQDHIMCPYCGYVDTDDWELAAHYGDDSEFATHCNDCGQPMTVIFNFSRTASTFKIKEKS